jgi:hypothetical protein
MPPIARTGRIAVLAERMERKPVTPTSASLLIRRESAAFTYLAVGAAIAALVPWGLALNAVPLHSPALRAWLFLAMGAAGVFFARRAGLEIIPTGFRYPLRTSVIIGAALAAYLLLIDALVFRSALPTEYRVFIVTADLPSRLLYFVSRSFNEGIVYQLFFGSALVSLIGWAWRKDGRIAPGAYWVGLMLAHLLNLGINTPLALTYDLFRFVAPGLLWVYLYRRHGLTTVLLAHAATHVFLQPLLGVALR